MNAFLHRFKNFLDELDPKQLITYLALTIGTVLLLLCMFVYLGYSRRVALLEELSSLNRNRMRARELLNKQQQVMLKKNEVDVVLNQDRLFYIKDFFDQVVTELGLTKNVSKEADVGKQVDLKNNYSETKLDASFANLSTQQLVDLFLRLEKNKRIYIKEIDITKTPQSKAINVTLTIATLQPSAGS